ncbi:MAG: hypothetical protein GY863_11000, partial [bacterium]|nr:hypothetical protein [bacterium]
GIVLPHDDRIYESDNFLTFSDASSDAVKREYSKMAEESLAEIMTAFGIESSLELGISGRETKITIFSNRFLAQNQTAFNIGFILYAQDSPNYLAWGESQRDRYKNIVKHETYHVFDKLFGMGSNYGVDRPAFWFKEGMAEYISGGASIPIETNDDLDIMLLDIQHYSHPIDVITGGDWVALDMIRRRYYPIFHLAIRYLMDEKGLGKTYQDVRSLYDDLLINNDFNSAFEQHMGITVEYYRENFFDLVRGILDN